jgi:predicted O-methyltransferase YrrM
MGQILPEALEWYLGSLNRFDDPVLLDVARQGEALRLPIINAEVGALLRVMTIASGAKRILEIGTAIGYSTLWLAGTLPEDGMVLSMEVDVERARLARENFRKADMAERINVMVGDAQRLVAKVAGPFDLIFQDGDKKLYGPMLDRLVELLRPGGLLITDNVLWDGEVVPGLVASPARDPEDTKAIADYNDQLASHPDLITTVIPLRDGVALSAKKHVANG